MNTKNEIEPINAMDKIAAKLTFNISKYGAEAILVRKDVLGSWDDLARGKGRSGYIIRTIDALPYKFGRSSTRHVISIEEINPAFSMEKLKELAANNSLSYY